MYNRLRVFVSPVTISGTNGIRMICTSPGEVISVTVLYPSVSPATVSNLTFGLKDLRLWKVTERYEWSPQWALYTYRRHPQHPFRGP